MSTPSLLKKVRRLEIARRLRTSKHSSILDELRAAPERFMTLSGTSPDPWQAELLRSDSRRMLLLCSRQAGKSTTAAALALRVAFLEPNSPILILSPTDRQSGELFQKIVTSYRALGRPIPAVKESMRELRLANGSRIVALPGNEKTVRCYSGVALLIIDEAARVPDSLYRAVRPMLAVSQGRLIALSTPYGKRGWFPEAWHSAELWERVRVTADECPRIPAEFLAEERQALGERSFAQEYHCNFAEAVGAVFAADDIARAFAGRSGEEAWSDLWDDIVTKPQSVTAETIEIAG